MVHPAPRFATPRNLSNASQGAEIAILAEGMGKPLMPWQRYVVDVGTEYRTDGSFEYEIVLVTVPRQSGKTTVAGPLQLHRVITQPLIKAFFTAQTGKDARSRFNDLVQLINESPLAPLVTVRRSAGDEAIMLPNRSALRLFSPGPAAIHGETPPLVTLDEIWHFDEMEGDEMLEGAIIPAQITLVGKQIWMFSTAGTALSTFMKKWCKRGREGYPRMAFFDWGLPDGVDPYDFGAMLDWHPAVGRTITIDALRTAASTTSRAEWLRAFCNKWTEAVNPVIAMDDWAALAVAPAGLPRRRDLVISYEVAPDNHCGVVMANWRDDTGAPCLRVLHTAPGTRWMVPLLRYLKREWQPAGVAADDGGPTRRITSELALGAVSPDGEILADPIEVYTTGPRDFATACDQLLTWARDEKILKHDGSHALSSAVAAVEIRPMGEGIRFSRQHSPGPIPALIAGAVGLWAYDHQEAPVGKPTIEF